MAPTNRWIVMTWFLISLAMRACAPLPALAAGTLKISGLGPRVGMPAEP